jgi:hypothetical protein
LWAKIKPEMIKVIFGIEGALNTELAGKTESRTVLTDALGKNSPW